MIGTNEAAQGEGKTTEKIDFPKRKPVITTQQPDQRVITHHYVLRESFTVELKLPADLTVIEADRLSAMIKTLPIQRYEEGEKP